MIYIMHSMPFVRALQDELFPAPASHAWLVADFLLPMQMQDQAMLRSLASLSSKLEISYFRTPYSTIYGRTGPRTVPSRLKLEALWLRFTVTPSPYWCHQCTAVCHIRYGVQPYTSSALQPLPYRKRIERAHVMVKFRFPMFADECRR
jgi:hypothetical protein